MSRPIVSLSKSELTSCNPSQRHFPFLDLLLPERELASAGPCRTSPGLQPSSRRLFVQPKLLRRPPAKASCSPAASLRPSVQRQCRCGWQLAEHDDRGDPDSVQVKPVLPRREELEHGSAAPQGGAGGSEERVLLVRAHRGAEGHARRFQVRSLFLPPRRPLLTCPRARRASPTNPQYQVRLFCTNEEYFNPSRTASAQQPAPMDFPGTCEVKLNAQNVVANTKGIKKQAGTAPPVNLSQVGDALNLAPSTLNKVEVVYVNTEKVRSFCWRRGRS